jgi:hypothetical protein
LIDYFRAFFERNAPFVHPLFGGVRGQPLIPRVNRTGQLSAKRFRKAENPRCGVADRTVRPKRNSDDDELNRKIRNVSGYGVNQRCSGLSVNGGERTDGESEFVANREPGALGAPVNGENAHGGRLSEMMDETDAQS